MCSICLRESRPHPFIYFRTVWKVWTFEAPPRTTGVAAGVVPRGAICGWDQLSPRAASSRLQKPPCRDLRWNATSGETSAAVSLSFTPCAAAIKDKGYETQPQLIEVTPNIRGVFDLQFSEGSSCRPFSSKQEKSAAHFIRWSVSAAAFEEKVILKRKKWDYVHIPVLINHCMAALVCGVSVSGSPPRGLACLWT